MRGEVKTNRTKGFWEAPAGWMGGRTRLLGGVNERERWSKAGGLFLVWTEYGKSTCRSPKGACAER